MPNLQQSQLLANWRCSGDGFEFDVSYDQADSRETGWINSESEEQGLGILAQTTWSAADLGERIKLVG